MCRVRCEPVTDGPGPNEQIVMITSTGGREEVVAPKVDVVGGALRTSAILGERNNEVLVELPRETSSGSWRVWVGRDQLVDP